VTIRFLPNDPLVLAALPSREQPARPDPNAPQIGFSYAGAIAEDVYPLDSAEFRFWQCREAALATLDAWAALAPLPTQWRSGQRLLPLHHDGGSGLNAQYDRTAVIFLGWETAAKKTYPAASSEAVAHEIGHALLDAVRPALWDSPYTETAAFHEAFGDCMALLVGLFDRASRQAVLETGTLRAPNVLEALAEDVAEGVRLEHGANHPQSVPRRALNILQWEIPVGLPPGGPPGALTAERHSFSRIFTGCFYDTVCNVFASQPTQDEQGLLAAAQIAGRLLIAGAQAAPEGARFFQAVGRAMVLEDGALSGGAHHAAIRDAFAGHQIAIGSTAMLAPTSGLSGAPPTVNRATGRASLSAGVRRDLLKRIGGRGRLSVKGIEIGGQAVAKAIHRRSVSLEKLDRRLKSVAVSAVESVLVGSSAARAVVLDRLPDASTTVDEVHHFVATLLEHGVVAMKTIRRGARRKTARSAARVLPTHHLRTRGGQKVLQRIRFSCGV
jgi:hypothetical protein